MEMCYMSPDDVTRLWTVVNKLKDEITDQTILARVTAERVAQMADQMNTVAERINNLPCTVEEIERIKMETRLQERMENEAAKLVIPAVEHAVKAEFKATWKRMFAVVTGVAGLISTGVGWLVAYFRIKGGG